MADEPEPGSLSPEEREARFRSIRAELEPMLLEQLEGIDEDIRALGGDPKSKAWDKFDIGDLAHLAETARLLNEKYGATLTVKPGKTHAGGRPSAFTRKKLEKALELKAKGYAIWSIAAQLGVSESTVKRGLKVNPKKTK